MAWGGFAQVKISAAGERIPRIGGRSKRMAPECPLKLKITTVSVAPDPRGLGAVGTPELLCTR